MFAEQKLRCAVNQRFLIELSLVVKLLPHFSAKVSIPALTYCSRTESLCSRTVYWALVHPAIWHPGTPAICTWVHPALPLPLTSFMRSLRARRCPLTVREALRKVPFGPFDCSRGLLLIVPTGVGRSERWHNGSLSN